MATVKTTNLYLEKPTVYDGAKETDYAANFDALDALVGGKLTKSVAGSSNVTLTTTEARNAVMEFTGTLTGNINVDLPSSASTGRVRKFIVKNSTSGAFTLTVRYSGGTGVSVTQGSTALLWHDGTNVYEHGASTTRPHASVTHNANQSIGDSSLTALAFNTESFDNNSIHNTVTNNSRLTLNKIGLWLVGGSVTWATNGTGIRVVQPRMNGDNNQRYGAGGAGGTAAGNVSDSVEVLVRVAAVTEYAELCVFQTSGGALNVELQTAFSPRFWAVWLAD